LIIALIGILALTVRDEIGTGSPTAAVASSDDTGDSITGSIGRLPAGQALALSDEQRGWIFLGVINLPDVPDTDLAMHRLAAPLPTSVALHDLPAMVTSRIPVVRDMRFVKLDDRILLVRPTDRLVVGEIPRFRVWQ
jgi:hypothetical protein